MAIALANLVCRTQFRFSSARVRLNESAETDATMKKMIIETAVA
ncbi:MAG: hypothetical protein RL730_1407, partial [Actinomycetota bacterium]